MRKIVFILASVLSLSFGIPSFAGPGDDGTIVLSFDDVIQIARDSAIQSLQASVSYEVEQLDYSVFLASRKWQLGFNLNPNYEMMSVAPATTYVTTSSHANILSTGATLNFEKLISKSGGYFYASTNFDWTQPFGKYAQTFTDIYGSARMFGLTPLRLGYRQELLGFNSAKWEKRQQDERLRTAGNEYAATMASVTETAAQYFFSYASAKAMFDMYELNAESADSLYRIGQRKYELTAIRKDELLSLQLQLMNSQNSVRSGRKDMEKARLTLLSFLNMKDTGVNLETVLPPNPDHILTIDTDTAIEMAKRHSTSLGQLNESRISAERDVDRTRREKGLQVNLDISVGAQKYGAEVRPLEAFNDPYATANVTLSIPLVNHGMRRDKYNAALKRLEYNSLQEQETERILRETVINTVNEVITQQQMLSETSAAMVLADESFSQNQYNYAQGLSDINTFTLAQNRKDQAHINYINALSSFWMSYYRLCSLTLYDFYNDKPL